LSFSEVAPPRRRKSCGASNCLGLLKKRTVLLRSLIAAPFSMKYRTRLAWLREEAQWRSKGIPQSHVTKALLYVEETGSFYIPVPKAGNTSVLAAIAKVREPVLPVDGIPAFMSQLRNTLQVGCVPADFRSGARVAFTVVRHPVDRFWSAYNQSIVESREGVFAAAVRSALGLDADKALTPDLLLDYVESQPVEDVDHHFRPQYAICGLEMLPVKVARCESLAEDLARLAEEGYFPKDSLAYVSRLNHRRSTDIHDRYHGIDSRIRDVYKRDLAVLEY